MQIFQFAIVQQHDGTILGIEDSRCHFGKLQKVVVKASLLEKIRQVLELDERIIHIDPYCGARSAFNG